MFIGGQRLEKKQCGQLKNNVVFLSNDGHYKMWFTARAHGFQFWSRIRDLRTKTDFSGPDWNRKILKSEIDSDQDEQNNRIVRPDRPGPELAKI